MTADEQFECTIHIADSRGRVRGCGFIIDPAHVMTCAHVLDLCRADPPGEHHEPLQVIGRKEDDSFRLVEVVHREKLPDSDVAILRLADGERFHQRHVVARWEECLTGLGYCGGGVVEIELGDNIIKLQRIQIGGTVGVKDTRTRFMVNATGDDDKIEEGCSGAAVFNVGGERGVIGMVAEYRQARSGTIIHSGALRDCWPEMIRNRDPAAPFFDLAPVAAAQAASSREGVAPMLILPDIADTIMLCDREAQTDPFRDRIRVLEKARRGALLTTIHGESLDLPDRLGDRLVALGPQALVRRRTAGSGKPLPQRNIDMAKCAAATDEAGIRAKIEYRLQDTLNAERPDVPSLARAIRKLGRPLTIEVRANEAFVAQRGLIAARAWSAIARELSVRDIGYPLFIFFIVERSSVRDGTDAMACWAVDDQHFLVLEELKAVPLGDVEDWALACYGEDQAEAIMRHIAALAPGCANVRLGDLQRWFSGQP